MFIEETKEAVWVEECISKPSNSNIETFKSFCSGWEVYESENAIKWRSRVLIFLQLLSLRIQVWDFLFSSQLLGLKRFGWNGHFVWPKFISSATPSLKSTIGPEPNFIFKMNIMEVRWYGNTPVSLSSARVKEKRIRQNYNPFK